MVNMTGRIDKFGFLRLQRPSGEKRAECPNLSNKTTCGDWCALFGEPRAVTDTDRPYVDLELCATSIIFDTLIDERGTK